MNEETKVFDELENEEVGMDMENYPETSGNGILKILAVGAAAVAGLAGGLAYKNRNKFTELRIKRLEKKGYTVIRPEPVEDVEPTEGSEDESK